MYEGKLIEQDPDFNPRLSADQLASKGFEEPPADFVPADDVGQEFSGGIYIYDERLSNEMLAERGDLAAQKALRESEDPNW